MCLSRSEVTCNECNTSFHKSFTGFLQLFSDVTVTTMNNTGFISYPVHDFFLEHFSFLTSIDFKNGLTQV